MEISSRSSEKSIVDLVDSEESPTTAVTNGRLSSRRRQRAKEVDSDDEPILNLFQEEDSPEKPPQEEELEEDEDESPAEEKARKEKEKKEFDSLVQEKKLSRLKFLLEKTSLYSTFLSQKISMPQAVADSSAGGDAEMAADSIGESSTKSNQQNGNGTKKRKHEMAQSKKEEVPAKKGKLVTTFAQPSLVRGGEMRSYQLQGVEWLVSLYENGLNGILADEMGLGKTVQCIALFAHLISMGVPGPFLVVGPLSTVGNWVREVKKWCPDVGVILYHGTKEERDSIRAKQLHPKNVKKNPIVVTSYEITMRDRKYLQRFKWKYIVVDEGHRLKNVNCKLISELKTYSSANRLLLTGTPLQNKLSELWSMLNFLLPDIFDDLDSFQQWFDFSDIGEKEGRGKVVAQEVENGIVSKLHEILRPFLLRRIKTEVELDLPPKK